MRKPDTRISKRRTLFAAAAALAALTLSTSIDAGPASKRTLVTTSHEMALPGVTLPPGTYVFEVVNPDSSADVVRVSARPGRAQARFLGLTRRVQCPRNLPRDQVLSLGEAPPAPRASRIPSPVPRGDRAAPTPGRRSPDTLIERCGVR